jgi:hypothetical protein
MFKTNTCTAVQLDSWRYWIYMNSNLRLNNKNNKYCVKKKNYINTTFTQTASPFTFSLLAFNLEEFPDENSDNLYMYWNWVFIHGFNRVGSRSLTNIVPRVNWCERGGPCIGVFFFINRRNDKLVKSIAHKMKGRDLNSNYNV